MQAMSDTHQTAYNDVFFDEKQEGAFSSASIIVPIIMKMINPNRVIDVGCGRGVWLRVFRDNGVDVIRGLDGSYINRSSLVIDPACFSPVDLSSSFHIDGQYDLAVCLEVAEHLPVHAATKLISMLTATAPVILFSAALPGQGGTDHVNEQWPEYWEKLFAEYGFRRLDPIRRHIMQDKRVEWWYRQNIFLYASTETLANSELLRFEKDLTSDTSIEWVYIGIHKDLHSKYSSTWKIWRELRISIKQAIKRRLNGEVPWLCW